MSDNLGLNQTRVLDPTDRSFESVVYQKKKPPLSCEVNLEGRLAADFGRGNARRLPSGWEVLGNSISDTVTEDQAVAGDVLCSSSYADNTFKLMASDKGIVTERLAAWVDGFRVVVQGTNSLTDENNIIILPTPPTVAHRTDFVFLEVWRQLVKPGDVVYKHGNAAYGGINPTNDLIDPAAGIETTLRIQVQYRIRVAPSDIITYPNGFDPYRVFAQAGLGSPLSCSLAVFQPVAGDLGLWRAGNGDTASQQTLNTVDGYSYAIPMFAVARRNTWAFSIDTHTNGAGKSRVDHNNGYASDRPDNLYNDWIVAEDILDMRHLVPVSQDLKAMAEQAFNKLIRGEVPGKITQSLLGEDHIGTYMTVADAVAPTDYPGTTTIAKGDGVCRVFSNAAILQKDTILSVPAGNGNISTTDTAVYPAGTVIASVDNVCDGNGATLTVGVNYTVTGTGTSSVTVAFIGTPTRPCSINYSIQFPTSADHGLTDLPIRFLESRNLTDSSSLSYAMTREGIRVRNAAPILTNDGTKFDYLYAMGCETAEPWDFGHQMEHHMIGNGSGTLVFPRTLNGYQILGIADIIIDGASTTYEVARDSANYTITMTSPTIVDTGKDVMMILYTAGKTFVGNNQARGIVDCYEMKELVTTSTGSSTYTFDTTNQAILAIGSSKVLNGYGFAYYNMGSGIQRYTMLDTNRNIPANPKNKFTAHLTDSPTGGSTTISVPVLVKSAITDTEAYSVFYRSLPYQGLLDSTAAGFVLTTGPALVTTAGSGLMQDQTYSTGTANFTFDSTVITGGSTQWTQVAKVGSTISADAYDSSRYVVAAVGGDLALYVTEPVNFSAPGATYKICNANVPQLAPANVVDRLPTLDKATDALCAGEAITTVVSDAYPVLETRVISPVQGIDSTVVLGVSAADRGRSKVAIPGAIYGSGALGLKFERLVIKGQDQKTYQTYVFDKDDTGRLYLMVVSSENDLTSNSRFFDHVAGTDTVDIFEMPGRPLRKPE